MKKVVLLLLLMPTLLMAQVPAKYNYPDTLWVYGNSTVSTYGLSPENSIKVGGGMFPKHIYRYLNSLTDSNGKKITYNRIGSCCNDIIKRDKPLTAFSLQKEDAEVRIYFDQYQWDYPKILLGYKWNELRRGYYGEFNKDSIYTGYGIYFFEDGGSYKGAWSDGVKEGKGVLYYPSDSNINFIEGNFINDKPVGIFKFVYKDGTESMYDFNKK
jgi:hypothetical protein